MHRYEQQLQRVRRYLDRLKKQDEGFTTSMPGKLEPGYFDDVHAFFQNCYHLKDWLKNDRAFTKKTRVEIEEYVSQTPVLAVCADICNGTKHLGLSKNPRSGAEPQFGQITAVIKLPEGYWDCPFGQEPRDGFRIGVKIEVLHDGKSLDALELAAAALEAWERFLM
jgi:hypothetical protein